jgi:membrane-bound lytic murein transglycosylase D
MKKRTEKISDFFKRWYRHLFAVPALMLLVILIKLFNFSSDDTVTDEDYRSYFTSNYKVFGITIPKDINFCGEHLPIDDFTVHEALERELLVNTYWQSQTVLLHKRAARWFPVIEPILKANGVPDDMKYVALAESGLTNVVSPQKATGFWQIMEVTANYYGLEISSEVDERYNVEKATQAACKVLLDAYKRYGNWTMAAASYNLGMGGIDKAISKQQTDSYYSLYLNEETARYIYRIVALKEIISRPKSYGYHLRQSDLYPPIPVTKVTVDTAINDLAAFAIAHGTTYKILKTLNPWMLGSSLTSAANTKYTVQLPAKGASLYGLEEETLPPNSMTVTDTSKYVTKAEITADSASRSIIYTVSAGDSWKTIADKFGVEVNYILEFNKREESKEPVAGEEIAIPRR